MKHDIYVFGSVVRGEVSATSDADILVIPVEMPDRRMYPADWSVYSRKTISEFFKSGRLFAWHLFRESRCIHKTDAEDWISTLGRPAEYATAKQDIQVLARMLRDSLAELEGGCDSPIYELGLCYTAIRDIAMAASPKLLGKPSFSRYSPYQLPLPVPLGKSAYDQAMYARHHSTRGTEQPIAIEETVRGMCDAPLLVWAEKLEGSV